MESSNQDSIFALLQMKREESFLVLLLMFLVSSVSTNLDPTICIFSVDTQYSVISTSYLYAKFSLMSSSRVFNS